MKETLRYALPMECGAQSVTVAGAMLMLSWHADNLATLALVRFHIKISFSRQCSGVHEVRVRHET